MTTGIESPTPVSRTAARHNTAVRRAAVYLTLAIASLLNFISYAPLDVRAHEKAWGDALNYYAMSEHTGAQVDNPFALRMLSPWLVHLARKITGLPLDVLWLGFTAAVTLACTVVFFEFCWRHLTLHLFTSVLAAIALSSTFWYGPYAFSNPFLVDPLNNLLYLIALWLLFKRKLLLFTLVIVVGTINKKTTLLLAPLYPLLAWTRSRSLRDRQVLFGVLATAVAALAYAGFRLWAQNFIGGNYSLGSGQGNHSLASNIVFALSSNKRSEHAALFDTFHFFWIIFGYGLYRLYRQRGPFNPLLVASGYLALCCLAGRMVATDTQRVFVMLAPLVIGVVAVVLDNQRSDIRRFLTGLLVFVYLALNLRFVPDDMKFLIEIGGLVLFCALLTRNAGPRRDTGARKAPA
ncbi:MULTISPECIES: hypothetical protein [Actinomycetes]|uniref:hypothetical protein n=1 Tax=Actinomycetes TaxID=1760 RepID=UPI0001B54060|nr:MULTISPECIES: hypothetical protein [Actinomycetes]